jgi:hypothetical protein
VVAVVSVCLLTRNHRPAGEQLRSLVAKLSTRLGLRSVPRAAVSERVREAIAVGLWRPLVLLPAAWLVEMTPEVLEAVIAHELAHIRRWDLWANLVQRLVETFLFYHPAVWRLSRRVSLEREMCADEAAVVATGERLQYAPGLELLGRRRLGLPAPQLGAAIGGANMNLLDRVRNVLGLAPACRKTSAWPAGLVALLVPAMIWFASANITRTVPSEALAEPAGRPVAGEEQSEWSKAVGGLSGRLTVASRRITTSEYLNVNLELKNVGTLPLAVQTENSLGFRVEIKNAKGDLVKPTWQVSDQLTFERWTTLVAGGSVRYQVGFHATDGAKGAHLATGTDSWKLLPGKYTLLGAYSSKGFTKGLHGPPPGNAWEGEITLPPVEIEVVTASDRAGKVIRDGAHADEGKPTAARGDKELGEMIRRVITRPWPGPEKPPRPPLTAEVTQGVMRELAAGPETRAAYAKLDATRRNTDWFDGIDDLAKIKAVWCLASGLCHPAADAQIRCAKALGQLKDHGPVPFMLVVARAFAVYEGGSENATTQGILQHALADALNSILGTSVRLKAGQDPEGLKAGLKAWGAAFESRKKQPVGPPNNNPGESRLISGGFRLDKATYCVGEPVFAVFEVLNHRDAPLSFDVGGDYRGSMCPLRFSVRIKNNAGRDFTKSFENMGGQGTTITLEPRRGKYLEHVLLSPWTHLLPPGEYTAAISRTLAEDASPRANPPTLRSQLHWTVNAYDADKLKSTLSTLDREDRSLAIRQGTFFMKPIDWAFADVADKLEIDEPSFTDTARAKIIERLPAKWDDRCYLEPRLEENRNWLTASSPEKYTLTFSILNNGNEPLDSGVFDSRVLVDGKELREWKTLLAEALKGKDASRIPAGAVLEFACGFNAYVQGKGTHEMVWRVNDRVSKKVQVRTEDRAGTQGTPPSPPPPGPWHHLGKTALAAIDVERALTVSMDGDLLLTDGSNVERFACDPSRDRTIESDLVISAPLPWKTIPAEGWVVRDLYEQSLAARAKLKDVLPETGQPRPSDHLFPRVSTRYSTASPLNGGVKDCREAPAASGPSENVVPVAGLNHSTASFRELGMAERSMVNEPPEGA